MKSGIFSNLFCMDLFIVFIIVALNTSENYAQKNNLGIGKYPGDPKENFAPSINYDTTTYKNIALLRPVYGSGSYDFCLTPQLLTDGIIEIQLPGWVVTSSSVEVYKRADREKLIDRNISSRFSFPAPGFWVQIEQAGNPQLPDVNGFLFTGTLSVDTSKSEKEPWEIIITGSNDGKEWKEIKTITDNNLFGDTLSDYRRKIYPQNYRIFSKAVMLNTTVKYRIYRAEFKASNILTWRLADFLPTMNGEACKMGGPYNFSSSWKSAGSENEWVYIDLGGKCSFDRINLYWLKRAESGSVSILDDCKNWNTIAALPKNSAQKDAIILDKTYRARYVRFNFDKAASKEEGYILSEIEVYGKGAPYAAAHQQAAQNKNGNIALSGGNWKLQRCSLVKDNIESISESGYNDKNWIAATVPGTALVSYLNNGMIPDPDFGDNQFLISDSYFYSDFIYRDEFLIPNTYKNKKVFLNLDGINWKADIYLNGKKAGRVEGAFMRGKFDVTDFIIPGNKNAIAVYIYKNDSPGFVKEPTFRDHQANGGELGLDNPTFHASVGWDWIPSVRGRNIGIWNEIYFSTSGAVTIEDIYVSSKLPLPDTTSADVNIRIDLKNHNNQNINGKLKIKFGNVNFQTPVSLSSSEIRQVVLNSALIKELQIKNPKLWWPNGYGAQNLYDVKIEFIDPEGKVSDVRNTRTGIREMSYSEEGKALRIWVNGKRFIARGGNWGFSESNLRYRGREYDIAVRYHKDMNLNMLRNWVGQTGDDEFYEACDKYGIMVWQDFWLANPGDGPNPKDYKLFMQNAEDLVKRIRNHPSIGIFCGRNEGYPPEELDRSIRTMLQKNVPDIHYIGSSANDIVSGHGPYMAKPLKYYFKERATPKFHSEIGLPSPVSYESMKLMMPDSTHWPINLMWGIHDFSMESAQEGENFMKTVDENFGMINNAKTWLQYSQWISYQNYRAIYEANSKNRMGSLIWMTHCAWPSLVFQTYDYYFEPTGAYFGCKKGSEPIHIQWNALTDSIEVVNYSIPIITDLSAVVELINIDGNVILKRQFNVNCPADQIKYVYKLEPLKEHSNTYFIRLKLFNGKNLLSENFYWRGMREEGNLDIAQLPKITLDVKNKSYLKEGKWFINTELFNNTKTPALMVQLKVLEQKSKKRILPVIFSDNFISLMPGEKKSIQMELSKSDAGGENPIIEIEGVNIN